MKIDKSLTEVLEWKEKAYEELKNSSNIEIIENIKRNADKLAEKYKIKDRDAETRKTA